MVLKCKYKIKEISNFSTFIKKQIISEVTIMKKKLLMVALAAVMATTSAFAFSGCGKKTDSTPDEAISTVDEATSAEEVTILETVPVDKVDAVKDMKLKVNEDGKIVDEKGNEVKPNEKGEVEIATEDGKKVKISADEVKAVNSGSNVVVTTAPKNTNSGNTNTNKGNSNSNNSSSNKGNTNNSGSNGGSSSAKPAQKPAPKPEPKPEPNPAQKPTPKPTPKPEPKPTEREKVWVVDYKTIHHPAEPAVTKTVHHEAVTHEEPVYGITIVFVCNQCGAELPDTNAEMWHYLDSDTCVSYHTDDRQVQVGTETIIDTPAWDEEIVVTPAKKAWDEKVEDGGHWEYK